MRAPISPASLATCLLLAACAHAPPPAGQNPSPMVEHARAHERIPATAVPAGARETFEGPDARPVEVFVPAALVEAAGRAAPGAAPEPAGAVAAPGSAARAAPPLPVGLLIHFHGPARIADSAVAALPGHDQIAASLTLGVGSGVYSRAFADPAAFDTLLARVGRAAREALGRPVAFREITLSGWSAGYGAVRAILSDSAHFARVDAVLLLDGIHAGYIPPRTPLAQGGRIDTTDLVPFLRFARAAAAGRKRFLITHSEIFPGTFASTTETTDWLLATLGIPITPVLHWGPVGMQQLSQAGKGGFTVLGFAGNTAPDHIDHMHGMPEFLARLEQCRPGSRSAGDCLPHPGS